MTDARRRRRALASAILLGIACSIGGVTAGASATATSSVELAQRDPLATFQALVARLDKDAPRADPVVLASLGPSITDLRFQWSADPTLGASIASSLLDFVGVTLATYDPAGREQLAAPIDAARASAVEALTERCDAAFVQFLTRDVLAHAKSQPIGRRRAAAWFLIGKHVAGSELGLLTAARDADARLASIAAEALVGFDADVVHRFFVDEYRSAARAGDPIRMLAERHFQSVRFVAGSPATEALTKLVRLELLADDWRRASQAVALTHAFQDEESVPWLIEALGAWKARAAAGLQALRVEHEIEVQLEHRSGRKLGLYPENWLAWWDAVRSGKIKKSSGPSSIPEATRPSFFNLDPRSDRVLFVIDRSGSMDTVFDPKSAKPGARAKTRWQEASEQLCTFVESLGPKARFDVVVFHEFGDAWRGKLVPADAKNLAAARGWLLGQRPLGGTQLRRGIDTALHVDEEGEADIERIEADTVIVLCDGATAEGSGWVEPFLERVNARLRIVFHCVQIGSGGDGTLEALAKGSGGDFVRVEK